MHSSYPGDLAKTVPEEDPVGWGPRRRWVGVGILLVAATGVYSIRLNAPFTSYREDIAAFYGIWAGNYLKYGYTASGFAPIGAFAPRLPGGTPKPHHLYSHRPPLVTLIMSLSCRLLGPRELAIRLVGLIFSVLTLAVFLALSCRILGFLWGLVASGLFAFTPNFAFYSVAAAHETFGVLGGLIIYLGYLCWRGNPRPRTLAFFLGASLFACWFDWPAYYAAGGVGVLHLLKSAGKRWMGILPVGCAVMAFMIFLGYLYVLDPEGLEPLRDLFSTGLHHSAPVGIGTYLSAHFREAIRWFTIPLLVLAAGGVTRLRPRSSLSDAVILSMVILGADAVLFMNVTFGHLFMTMPLVPFAALSGARGLRLLVRNPRVRWSVPFVLLAFLGQAAVTLHRAHTNARFPYYMEMSHALARALAAHTAPQDRCLVMAYHQPAVAYFYTGRELAHYLVSPPMIEILYDRRVENGVDEESLVRRLSRDDHGFAWFITTNYSLASGVVPSLRLLASQVPDPDSFARERYFFEGQKKVGKLSEFLRKRYHVEMKDGFIFYDLRRPR